MERACVRAGIAGLLACVVFAGVALPASGQREERSRARVQEPTELLREYPFEQGRLRSRQRSDARATRPAGEAISRSAAGARDAGGGSPVLWLVIGAFILLALLGLIARRARRPSTGGARSREASASGAGAEQRGPDAAATAERRALARPSARFPRRTRPSPAANRYAVANQKGGVGKTTVSLALGAAAARRGKRVLLVDLDPQASATAVLGADPDQASIADVLVDGSSSLGEVVVPTTWGLDLVPADRRLRLADTGATKADKSVLDSELATLADYDLVLIDCPPSLGRLTLEALNAVSQVLVVTEPTYLTLHAMKELRDTLDSVANEQNPGLELAGLVLNRVESTAEHKRSVAELEANFGSCVWTPYVPKRAILQDAMRQRVPPQDLGTHSHYASEVAEIFDQLVERLGSMKPEPARNSSASGGDTVEPNEESDALRKLRAYYERECGPMSPEESRDLLRRIVEGNSCFTLAELKALEHAGLAYGESVPRPADAPKPWAQGPTALAERAYRRIRVGS
jgi:chromosome partitioning protein